MSTGNRSILIIEDDAVVAGIYRSKFEKAGYEAEVVLDGQTGFYRVMEMRPHALMLDLMLPNIKGIDILKKIRAQKQFRRMPILVLTNSYLSEVALDAAQSGATEVFDKATATPAQLIEAANKALYLAPAGGTNPIADKPASIAVGAETRSSGGQPAAQLSNASGPTPASKAQESLEPLFLKTAPQNLVELRINFQMLTRENSDQGRLEQLTQLSRKTHSVTSHAGIEGLRNVAQFGSALEALIESLRLAPEKLNPSTTATLASSIDFLGELLQERHAPAIDFTQPSNILVVDDEEVPRRNIVRALSVVRLSAVGTDNADEALELLSEKPFDLVFLDVEMPGVNGFELCARIRKLLLQKDTPVIFVTALTAFQDRVRSKLSGGNEFIAKPFLIIELAVKALKHVMRGRLAAQTV